ncbi:ATP-binding protein involved in chromosome partitioning [Hymenobacter luteus]|uniref:Iron-sulfur cluster carrier protein n=2 Tax=Hymenobacter TaxID=89966 RepID=A0A7W9T2R5_9BACT|nr:MULTISPECIES: Mrp/NBP35 family ATP-binding protein [Hymenobacter]MBB4602167.1 ATP-binding protein involved in chromosome partitioning [Hymenobacter latericoloratus]MBB6059404.1 ATP-binding protein involved in chromosome partitioning [Hymenobacter luteus]
MATITKEAVLKALSYVEEPDLGKDLVTLNMIEDVAIEGRRVSFTVVLTTPACPLKQLIHDACERAIHTMVDSEAEVVIVMTSRVTTMRQNQDVLPGVKNIIAIASGKGGVGKSTVTANLAIALAKTGAKVGLVDADISGPSMPLMFGVEDARPHVYRNEQGRNLIQPVEAHGVKLMSIGFLAPAESAIVWRGPMASSALKQFITEVEWGGLDYLLLDMPPGTSDIHLTMVQTVPVTGSLIVTTPQKVALADAEKGLQMFRLPQINVPVLGIVENMAWFTPAELPENKYFIFGEGGGQQLADKHQVPLLGHIPLVQSIRENGDQGTPAILQEGSPAAAVFEQLAEDLARQVSIRNAVAPRTNVVQMNS